MRLGSNKTANDGMMKSPYIGAGAQHSQSPIAAMMGGDGNSLPRLAPHHLVNRDHLSK